MNSRLLTHIEESIARSADPAQADRWRADRAGVLAREGRVAESREALKILLSRPRPPLGLRAATLLADALADYYGEVGEGVRGKLEQALAWATEAGEASIQARCEAWLAHLDHVDDNVEGTPRHAARALQLAAADDHGARSRAAMVVAMAYHYAGRFDRAQPWYATSRRHASAEGDDATLSALIFNMGALRGEHVRRAAVFDDIVATQEDVEQALAAGESSSHFDARLGGSALEVLRPILRAGVLVAQKRYAQALVLYEAYFGHALAQGLGRFECSLRADVAWCRLQLRQPDVARQQAEAALAAVRPGECNIDDVALTHGRLALVYAALDEPALAGHHRTLASQHWLQHTERRARSVLLLDRAFGASA